MIVELTHNLISSDMTVSHREALCLINCARKAILDLLREDSVSEAALSRVHVPIGLDLGAQSAPEIALAVLAEILAVQRGATGLPISEKVKRGIK